MVDKLEIEKSTEESEDVDAGDKFIAGRLNLWYQI